MIDQKEASLLHQQDLFDDFALLVDEFRAEGDYEVFSKCEEMLDYASEDSEYSEDTYTAMVKLFNEAKWSVEMSTEEAFNLSDVCKR